MLVAARGGLWGARGGCERLLYSSPELRSLVYDGRSACFCVVARRSGVRFGSVAAAFAALTSDAVAPPATRLFTRFSRASRSAADMFARRPEQRADHRACSCTHCARTTALTACGRTRTADNCVQRRTCAVTIERVRDLFDLVCTEFLHVCDGRDLRELARTARHIATRRDGQRRHDLTVRSSGSPLRVQLVGLFLRCGALLRRQVRIIRRRLRCIRFLRAVAHERAGLIDELARDIETRLDLARLETNFLVWPVTT